jgi:pSer/pThr/pTyr-binding forkhead associated (FHA) protein
VVVNGTEHPLQQPGLVVGRGTEADLRINDPGISRRHIEFEVEPGQGRARHELVITVRDLGSTNGMLVDDRKITRAQLRDGSTVRIGNTTMTVRVTQEDVEERSAWEVDGDV